MKHAYNILQAHTTHLLIKNVITQEKETQVNTGFLLTRGEELVRFALQIRQCSHLLRGYASTR